MIIVVIAIRGYKILVPILMFLNKIYKRRVFDFVVGGSRYKIYNNKKMIKLSNKMERIYVETENIKEEYNKYGIKNVEVISNFKNLKKTDILKKYDKSKIKVCVFSRIIKEKGIGDSINSVCLANKKLGKDIFDLDIFGIINKKYKKEFNELINSSDYVEYKGSINYDDSVKTLEKYDVMLFLTYYKNEGFAGTIIDAFYSGVPLVATDWHNNFEILKDKKTGLKVSINNIEEVSDKLIYLYNNLDLLEKMRNECLKESDNYNSDIVMKKFIEII